MKKQTVQMIKNDRGDPEFAVVPWTLWSKYAAMDGEDGRLVKLGDAHRDEETFPADVARRLVNGETPLKVIREWRRMSQAALARESGIAEQYISQLERRRDGRHVGRKNAKRLAEILGVSAEVLMDI